MPWVSMGVFVFGAFVVAFKKGGGWPNTGSSSTTAGANRGSRPTPNGSVASLVHERPHAATVNCDHEHIRDQ